MPIEVVSDFGHLMHLAKQLGEAKKTGDPKLIQRAQDEHDVYQRIVLNSDKVNLGITINNL